MLFVQSMIEQNDQANFTFPRSGKQTSAPQLAVLIKLAAALKKMTHCEDMIEDSDEHLNSHHKEEEFLKDKHSDN